MAYFDGFGNYGNSTNQKLEVTDGNSASKKNGDSYSGQDGNSTSHSIGNLNSFRRGYSNSLVEGFNFSTTLGASFSTVVGANVPNTAGGKIEMISPWSVKWTRGTAGLLHVGYDYDFKSCETQVKANEGKNIYTYNDKGINNFNYTPTDKSVADSKDNFFAYVTDLVKEKTTYANFESKKVLKGVEKYGAMTTTVAGVYELSVGGEASGMQLEASGIGLGTIGTVLIQGDLAVSLVSKGKATVNGSIIKVG